MDHISNQTAFYLEKRPSRVLRLSDSKVPKLVGVRGRISPIFLKCRNRHIIKFKNVVLKLTNNRMNQIESKHFSKAFAVCEHSDVLEFECLMK